MRKLIVWNLICIFASCALAVESSVIWSDKPARDWNGYYPIGNGVMGAMVAGGGSTHIQFNHTRLWSGTPHGYDHAGAADVLPQLRELTLAGKKETVDISWKDGKLADYNVAGDGKWTLGR